RGVPLGTALKRLYAGTPVRVEVAPALADAPVTAELRGVTREAALRILLRVCGQSGIVREAADLLTISQRPAGGGISGGTTGATNSATFNFTNGSGSGFPVGPRDRPTANQSVPPNQATRQVPHRQSTYVGGKATDNLPH